MKRIIDMKHIYACVIMMLAVSCTVQEPPEKPLSGNGFITFTVEDEEIATKTYIGVNEADNIFTTEHSGYESYRFGAFHSYMNPDGTRNLKNVEGSQVVTDNPYFFKVKLPEIEQEEVSTLEAVYLLVNPADFDSIRESSTLTTSENIVSDPVDNVLASFYFGPERENMKTHSSNYADITKGYDPRWGYIKNNGALPDSEESRVFTTNFIMKRPTSLVYFHIKTPLDEKILSAKLSVDGDPIACDAILFGVRAAENSLEPYCDFAGEKYNSITETFSHNYRYERANDFRLFFNVLPGTYNSLTLEITTQSKRATISRNVAGVFEAGCLSKAVLELSNDIWQHNGNTLYRVGGMEFVVPDGALTEGSISSDSGFWGKSDLNDLTVCEDSTAYLPMERENFLGAVDLLPHGLEFADSVTVTIPMQTATNRDVIDVQYYNEEDKCWNPENEAIVNHEENTIMFKVKHFSRYTYSDQDNLLKVLVATLKNGLRNHLDDEELAANMTRTVRDYYPYMLGSYVQHRWFMETIDASSFNYRIEHPDDAWGYTFGDYEVPDESIHYYQNRNNGAYWYGLYFTMTARYPRQLQCLTFSMDYQCDEGSGTLAYVYPIQGNSFGAHTPSMDELFSDPYFITKHEWMDNDSETLHSVMHSTYSVEKEDHQEVYSWSAVGMYRCEAPDIH